MDNFCEIAKEKHCYNMEQALGMLFWHKHDIKKSLSDMHNFTPMPGIKSLFSNVGLTSMVIHAMVHMLCLQAFGLI